MPLKNLLIITAKGVLLFSSVLIMSSKDVELKDAEKKDKYTVIIDAGHGGNDTGAIGYRKLREKDITLNMALVTKATIESLSDNIVVVLTRSDDSYVSLKDRTKIAKSVKGDLFISIHCDAIHKSKVKGTTVYVQKRMNSKNYAFENYKQSVKIGLMLGDLLEEKLKLKSRGLKFNNYQVLRETLGHMPSILIETGYITNNEEAKYFIEKGQKGIGITTGLAVVNYFNKSK